MRANRAFVDRRSQPRFEIVGDLWGTLETTASLPIVDLGPGGALVASDVPWELGSVHMVVMADGERVGRVKVRVRHVTSRQSGEKPDFLVGLEFVTVSADLAMVINAWIAQAGSEG